MPRNCSRLIAAGDLLLLLLVVVVAAVVVKPPLPLLTLPTIYFLRVFYSR